jgi:hypothetical protein
MASKPWDTLVVAQPASIRKSIHILVIMVKAPLYIKSASARELRAGQK